MESINLISKCTFGEKKLLQDSYFTLINVFFLHIGNNNEAQAFLSRGGQVIVRMRGLPYDCTPKQVVS